MHLAWFEARLRLAPHHEGVGSWAGRPSPTPSFRRTPESSAQVSAPHAVWPAHRWLRVGCIGGPSGALDSGVRRNDAVVVERRGPTSRVGTNLSPTDVIPEEAGIHLPLRELAIQPPRHPRKSGDLRLLANTKPATNRDSRFTGMTPVDLAKAMPERPSPLRGGWRQPGGGGPAGAGAGRPHPAPDPSPLRGGEQETSSS